MGDGAAGSDHHRKTGGFMTTAFLIDGVRTPFGRYGGALAPMRPDDLAAHVLRALAERLPSVDWAAVDDVVLGCANQAGEDNRNVARMAWLLAGLPVEVSGSTVNRLCGSGLDALGIAARAVRAGESDLVVAGGVESMTRAPFVLPKAASAWSRSAEVADTTIGWRLVNPRMDELFGTDSMPGTAENVARDYGVSREDQDAFALHSQERAGKAGSNGRLAREITPVPVPQRRGDPVVVERDEHPRETSLEALARLRPLFPGGSVTAGNSSGVNDGAAALLVASERAVDRYGLTPLARVTAAAAAGVPPRVMGIGPEPATRKLLARVGIGVGDVDVVELNEAFAAQALAVLRGLGLPDDAEHVNPNGGAIALGHPLGASGARLALSAALELGDRAGAGARRAVATMCIGVGQGIAVLLETA
jgi:3-oxoadipyl-CoA thiolase